MERKVTSTTRGPNKEEKKFQAWLKEQRCCVSGIHYVDVHHCKGATFKHNKTLIGHWFCIPLCRPMHNLYHREKRVFHTNYGRQCDLWLKEVKMYEMQTGATVPENIKEAVMNYGK